MPGITTDQLLRPDGPICLVAKATLSPVGDVERFQPAGFPEVGHVIYDAPTKDGGSQKVCILDSPASMANHLETVCLAGPNDYELHPDLAGLPYLACVTDREYDVEEIKAEKGKTARKVKLKENDPKNKLVVTSLTEGHRLASDYFLDGQIVRDGKMTEGRFRDQLRKDIGIREVKKDKVYFLHPEDWWPVYKTVFRYDPNSLVHGILLAQEQIKISRVLTAHSEAFGAARVGRAGVKFDRLGKTLSGQPIFAVDEETAKEIRATFILDLALLRSYGRGTNGLDAKQKLLLLSLAIWKIERLLARPFRFRSNCHLACKTKQVTVDDSELQNELPHIDIRAALDACGFTAGAKPTTVYYPADRLFKLGEETEDKRGGATDDEGENGDTAEEGDEE